MNEQDSTHPGSEVAPTSEHGTAVQLDEGHVVGDGGLPERFENPGLPAHLARMADLDENAARRAEKQVATLFGISIVGTLLFIVFYFAISLETTVFVPGIGVTSASNLVLGVTMAMGLLGIGFGAVHWAKTLMPDEEVVEDRHPMRASDESRDRVVEELRRGRGELADHPPPDDQVHPRWRPGPVRGAAGPAGRRLARADAAEQPVADLLERWPQRPRPDPTFKPLRLMRDPENTPVQAEDVTIGSVFHIMPEGLLPNPVTGEGGTRTCSRRRPRPPSSSSGSTRTSSSRRRQRDWGYNGIVAYSKICTHVGCPVGLYEQHTHHLLCPCHQSTFDVTQDCKVIFGPAKRPLPQLQITVDDEGYLVSAAPFQEAVGPSFWERGSR